METRRVATHSQNENGEPVSDSQKANANADADADAEAEAAADARTPHRAFKQSGELRTASLRGCGGSAAHMNCALRAVHRSTGALQHASSGAIGVSVTQTLNTQI